MKHPVFWLIIFQSGLAVASSWLFYLTARLLAPRGAFVLSLVFIASLLPFLNVKSIMTEQMFLFETMLTLYGIVAYLVARTNGEEAGDHLRRAGHRPMTLRGRKVHTSFPWFAVFFPCSLGGEHSCL